MPEDNNDVNNPHDSGYKYFTIQQKSIYSADQKFC